MHRKSQGPALCIVSMLTVVMGGGSKSFQGQCCQLWSDGLFIDTGGAICS
jgi:hypothetical protein